MDRLVAGQDLRQGPPADVVDELALLLDLKDVYWAKDGRKSVDVAVLLVAGGATFAVGLPFWSHARRALRS